MIKKITKIVFAVLLLPVVVFGQKCIKFDGIATGTMYGSGYNSPGDVIITEDGIDVSVADFYWNPTTTHFGACEIVAAFPGFGDGTVMSMNNINLVFNFASIAPTALISLEFADFGGIENLEINGHQVYIDEFSWNMPGNPAPGITLYYSTILSGYGFLKTKLLIYGNVHTLLIGGQEFFIENICSHEGGGTINRYCVDFESRAMGDRFGDTINMPGDYIFSENHIDVFVYDFFWDPLTTHFGNCEILAATPDFGDGQVMAFNNVNLRFDFGVFGTVNRVMFDYADYGGFENVEINGQPIPLFMGELALVPGNVVPGLTWYISKGYTSFTKATVMIMGNVQNFIVGGQEFKLDNVCVFTPTSVAVENDQCQCSAPTDFRLGQNYPNPFNAETTIEYSLTKPGLIQLYIYNSLGQRIRVLVKDQKAAGIHQVVWDGRDDHKEIVHSGIYFCRIISAEFEESKKMLLLK